MNKPDPTEVLNENISYLVDIMKLEIDEIGQKHDFTPSQISEMEKDFIARLAFAAIIGDDEKESEKKPEKSEGLPSDVINALLYVKRMCEGHECDDCPFGSSGGLFCHLYEAPSNWEV